MIVITLDTFKGHPKDIPMNTVIFFITKNI